MRRKRVLSFIALLALAVAAALVVLPASWLAAALPAHWPLAIVDTQGTVWKGTAAVAIGPAHQRRRLSEPLRWEWSFSRGPQLAIQHRWLSGPLTLALTPTGLAVSAQTLSVPAGALATLDARLAAVGPEGRLTIRWPTLRFSPSLPAPGTRLLDAEWRDAASALAPIRPLGHYTLSMTAGDGISELQLASRQGPLLLEGKGGFNARQGLDFTGTARADPTANEAVHRALQDVLGALGPRQNNVTLLRLR